MRAFAIFAFVVSIISTGSKGVCAFSTASVNGMANLAAVCNSTTAAIIELNGSCGLENTTQAITANSAITNGSACPAADQAIAVKLESLSQAIVTVTNALSTSVSSTAASATAVSNAFNSFSSALYTLFNELDLATCTFELTPASATYGITFGTAPSGYTNIEAAYNNIATVLNSQLAISVLIAPANLAMQTHFTGTSNLASQVAASEAQGFVACSAITTIVCVETAAGGPQVCSS